MRQKLTRFWCFLFGHDNIQLFSLSNISTGGRSAWGTHKCLRCGREESWQYDF